jgi:hypothetical protein
VSEILLKQFKETRKMKRRFAVIDCEDGSEWQGHHHIWIASVGCDRESWCVQSFTRACARAYSSTPRCALQRVCGVIAMRSPSRQRFASTNSFTTLACFLRDAAPQWYSSVRRLSGCDDSPARSSESAQGALQSLQRRAAKPGGGEGIHRGVGHWQVRAQATALPTHPFRPSSHR